MVKATYAIPVYSNEYIQSDNGNLLELTISDTLFLETLLFQLRGQIIKFSKNLKKEERKEENSLITAIKILQEEVDSGNENQQKNDSLREQSLRLENLGEKQTKGSIVRSRANIIDDWEKPSKSFLNLEKGNFTNKNIPSLTTANDKIITDSIKILEIQKTSIRTSSHQNVLYPLLTLNSVTSYQIYLQYQMKREIV